MGHAMHKTFYTLRIKNYMCTERGSKRLYETLNCTKLHIKWKLNKTYTIYENR